MNKHCLLNLYGANRSKLDDLDVLLEILKSAVYETGATYIDHISKKFDPQGVTIIIMLAESHISIHTWPEKGEAMIDVFTCGKEVDPLWAVPVIVSALQPNRYTMEMINR